MDKFINRSESDRDKVVMFTNNVTLWKRRGPNGEMTSLRTDESLPRIPEDYSRERGYNIMDEMNWFIGEYVRTSNYNIDGNLYNAGDDDAPQVHVHFALNR